MVWSKIVWFQIMNLMVWVGSEVGQSVSRNFPLGIFDQCHGYVVFTTIFRVYFPTPAECFCMVNNRQHWLTAQHSYYANLHWALEHLIKTHFHHLSVTSWLTISSNANIGLKQATVAADRPLCIKLSHKVSYWDHFYSTYSSMNCSVSLEIDISTIMWMVIRCALTFPAFKLFLIIYRKSERMWNCHTMVWWKRHGS